MSDALQHTDELPENAAKAGGVADVPADDAAPADVFEHLARIRAGISDGVITLW